MMWTETIESFLNEHSDGTAIQYRMALDNFAEWYHRSYGQDPEPELLTGEEVREWRTYLSSVRNLKAATVNTRLAAVKSLVRFCGRDLRVKGIGRVEAPIDPLTGRELGRLFATVENHQWGPEWMPLRNVAVITMMARAGLRVSEVVALNVVDVEINTRSGSALVRRGKGIKERRVPLPLQARKVISAYLEVRPRWVEGNALIIGKTGKRVKKRGVQRLVTNAAQRAGIEKKVTPHVLGHTFATRFLENAGEGGLKALQQILGRIFTPKVAPVGTV